MQIKPKRKYERTGLKVFVKIRGGQDRHSIIRLYYRPSSAAAFRTLAFDNYSRWYIAWG